MYKNITDPKITKDLEKIRKGNASFAKKYKGKISSLNAIEFADMLKEKEKLLSSIERRKKLLSNENYVNKAPANVVENDRIQLEKEQSKLEEILSKLN